MFWHIQKSAPGGNISIFIFITPKAASPGFQIAHTPIQAGDQARLFIYIQRLGIPIGAVAIEKNVSSQPKSDCRKVNFSNDLAPAAWYAHRALLSLRLGGARSRRILTRQPVDFQDNKFTPQAQGKFCFSAKNFVGLLAGRAACKVQRARGQRYCRCINPFSPMQIHSNKFPLHPSPASRRQDPDRWYPAAPPIWALPVWALPGRALHPVQAATGLRGGKAHRKTRHRREA